MEYKTMVGLIPQARLVRQNNKIGVSCPDCTIWSTDDFQAVLLETIEEAPQSVEELKTVLMRVRDGPVREEFAALMLAEFILIFDKVIGN